MKFYKEFQNYFQAIGNLGNMCWILN
jgi:hypothetical protein